MKSHSLFGISVLLIAYMSSAFSGTEEKSPPRPAEIQVDAGTYYVGSVFGDEDYKSNANVTLPAFMIMQTEVTCNYYLAVRKWAQTQGYLLNEASCHQDAQGNSDKLPYTNTSWWNAITFANAASAMQHLQPVYTDSKDRIIKKALHGKQHQKIKINPQANGYRLPSIAQWQIAARGGKPALAQGSYGKLYAGSDNKNSVAWHSGNADGHLHAVATKAKNQLGLYDMSGNAAEWTESVVSLGAASSDASPYIMMYACGDSALLQLDNLASSCDAHSLGYRSLDLGLRLVRPAPLTPP